MNGGRPCVYYRIGKHVSIVNSYQNLTIIKKRTKDNIMSSKIFGFFYELYSLKNKHFSLYESKAKRMAPPVQAKLLVKYSNKQTN